MDHSELVSELPRIEKLTAAERLKLAHDRRLNQIFRHEQYERDLSSKRDKQGQRNRNGKNRPVRFIHSVMLLEAAARNDIEEVRRLLMQGVSPDSQNEDGLTALHQCCIDDSEEMMKLLLEFGANVNAEDSEKWTPLHAAATCGHIHLVKYLISRGANLLAVNADGNMPYDICEDESTLDYIESEMAQRGITQELIDETRTLTERKMLTELKAIASKGGSLEFPDSVGARPLHVASANGYLSVVEFLLDQHVATDSKDNDGWQPIHAAACWGHLEVLELLVQNGSDLNAQTKNHETPYDICEDPEMKSRIAALRSEQESRARADPHKGRRSQSMSTNTRTHSIRRNSTRDKGQISKRQIKNEAIFGIQNNEQHPSQESHRHEAIPDGEAKPKFDSKKGSDQAGRRKNAPAPPSNKNSDPTDNASGCEFVSPTVMTASATSDQKIDIHVSVTINTLANGGRTSMSSIVPCLPLSLQQVLPPSPISSVLSPVPSLSGGSCTLADLKKQRSLTRVGQLIGNPPNSCLVSRNNASNTFNFGDAEMTPSSDLENGHHPPISSVNWQASIGKTKKIPDSNTNQQSTSLPKFQGETTELVGSKAAETSCCLIS